MTKPTKRKAFNFLRSYFDVLNELPNDKDKLSFLLSIINKQFLDEDPKELNFISNLCYESQRHQIESSVNGWKRANKDTPITDPMTDPPTNPMTDPMTDPKEEEEEEKGEEEEEVEYTKPFSFYNSLLDLGADKQLASEWIKVRKTKKGTNSQTALNNFTKQVEKSKANINDVLNLCVVNSWAGFKAEWYKGQTSTDYDKFKRLHLTQVGTIRSQCREKPLLDILLKRCDCTAEEIHKYILFREANNYLNTYEV